MDEYTEKYLELNKRFKEAGAAYIRRNVMGAVDYDPFTARSQFIGLPRDLNTIIAEFKRLDDIKNPLNQEEECKVLADIEGLVEAAEEKYLS